MKALGADSDTLSEADDARESALKSKQVDGPTALTAAAGGIAGSFQKGDIVRLKAQPDCIGAVVEVLAGTEEPRYQVFHDGKVATYYASQIEPSQLRGIV